MKVQAIFEFDSEDEMVDWLNRRTVPSTVAEVLAEQSPPAATDKELRAAINEHKGAKGIEAISAVLAKHGATKVSDLEEQHIGSVIAAIGSLPDA